MGQYCFARWRLSSVVVCNAAGGLAGRPPGAWAVVRRRAWRVGGRAADTARRASNVTSRQGDILLDVSLGVHYVPPRLLQFAAVKRVRQHLAENTIRTESRRTFNYWNSAMRTYYCSPGEVALPSCSSTSWIQALMLSAFSPGGQTPAYLASDIQLIADTGRTQLQSASERICVVPRTQQFRRQKFFCCRSYLRQDTSYRHCHAVTERTNA